MSEVRYEFVAVDKNLSKVIENIDKTLLRMDETMNKVSTTSDNMLKKMSGNVKSTKKNVDTLTTSLKKMSNVKLLNFNPKSINEAKKAITELKKRRDRLNSSDKNYSKTLSDLNQRIQTLTYSNRKLSGSTSKIVSGNNRVAKSFRNQVGAISQVRNQLAGLFGIYGAERFISQMIKIRGEFELQSVALGAMLQNKRLADDLFQEVQAMALKSPFKILELNKYLKQLKAYRIENENLTGTLKMLGDISAGLGVSMDRLILAYGQVKAASVLRGQELRQFTEAGIPLVDALAKKFTELNHKLVTTGEVFELISKRAVSFEMVKDIFKDMTKEGGVFFDQQLLQSQTLSGRISVLRDAWDKMLNTMGKSNEGGIKNTIKLARTLIDNYKNVIAVLKVLITTYGVYKAIQITSMIMRQVKSLYRLTKALKAGKRALLGFNAASLANPYVAVATAVIAVTAALYQYHKRQQQIIRDAIKSVQPLREKAMALDDLNKKYKDINTTEEERIKILGELQKINPEIVKGYENEGKAIQDVTDKIEEQSAALQGLADIKLASALDDNSYFKQKDVVDNLARDMETQKGLARGLLATVSNSINNYKGNNKRVTALQEIVNSDKTALEKIKLIYKEYATLRDLFKRRGNSYSSSDLARWEFDNVLSKDFTNVAWKLDEQTKEYAKATSLLEKLKVELTEKINAYAANMFPDNVMQQFKLANDLFDKLNFGVKIPPPDDYIKEEWKAITESIDGLDFENKDAQFKPKPDEGYVKYINGIVQSYKDAKEELKLFNSENVNLTKQMALTNAERKKAGKTEYKTLKDYKEELERILFTTKKIADTWSIPLESNGSGSGWKKSINDEASAYKDLLKLMQELRNARVTLDKASGRDEEILPREKEKYTKIFNKEEYKNAVKEIGLDPDKMFKDFSDKDFDKSLTKFQEAFAKAINTKAGNSPAGKLIADKIIKDMNDTLAGIRIKQPLTDEKNAEIQIKAAIDLRDKILKELIPDGANDIQYKISVITQDSETKIAKLNAEYEKMKKDADGRVTDAQQKELDKRYAQKVENIKKERDLEYKNAVQGAINKELGSNKQFYDRINDATLRQILAVNKAMDKVENRKPLTFITDEQLDVLNMSETSINDLLNVLQEDGNINDLGLTPEKVKIIEDILRKSKVWNKELDKIKVSWEKIMEPEVIERVAKNMQVLASSTVGLANSLIDLAQSTGDTQMEDFARNLLSAASAMEGVANIAAGFAQGPAQGIAAIITEITKLIQAEAEAQAAHREAMAEIAKNTAIARKEYNLWVADVLRGNEYILDSYGNLNEVAQDIFGTQNPFTDAIAGANAYSKTLEDITAKSYDYFKVDISQGPVSVKELKRNLEDALNDVGKVQIDTSLDREHWWNFRKDENPIYDSLASQIGVNNIDIFDEEQLQKALSMYDSLDDKTKMLVDDWKEYSESMQESITQINDSLSGLVGNLAGDWSDALVKGFIDGSDAALTMQDSVEGIIEKMLEQVMVSTMLKPIFDKLQKDMYKSFGLSEDGKTFVGGGDQNAADDVARMFDNTDFSGLIGNWETQMQTFKDQFQNFGLDLWSPDDAENGLANGIKGITEDTANIIAAYLNTIRHHVILNTGYMEQILGLYKLSQTMATEQLSRLASIDANTLRMANILEASQNGTRILHVA